VCVCVWACWFDRRLLTRASQRTQTEPITATNNTNKKRLQRKDKTPPSPLQTTRTHTHTQHRNTCNDVNSAQRKANRAANLRESNKQLKPNNHNHHHHHDRTKRNTLRICSSAGLDTTHKLNRTTTVDKETQHALPKFSVFCFGLATSDRQ